MNNIYNAIQNLYNMDKTTWQEVLAELYNLVANVENKFDLFELKFGSLLGEQITRELKKMCDDGSLGSLINDKLLKDINTKIDTFKTEVSEQVDTFKTEVNEQVDTFKTEVNEQVDTFKTEVSEQLNTITQEVDKINDNLTSTINVERSEILKTNKVYLEDGVETVGNSEWHTSSFIDISNGGIIVGYGIRKQDGIAFYDEDKNYVTSIKPTIATDSVNILKAEITVKKDQYKYCRVVSCVYIGLEFVGSVTTYANAIETLESRVAILEKNIRIANDLLNNHIGTTLPYR